MNELPRAFRLLVVTLLAAACDRDPLPLANDTAGPVMDSPFDPARKSHQPPEVHPIREWATTEDYRVRVHAVTTCTVAAPFEAREGYVKLGIDFEIEGTSERAVPVSPLHAHLRASNGARFSATLAGCTPALPSRRLQDGQQARGFLTFEIPEDAGGLVMSYTPFVIGRAPSEVVVDLQR